MYDYESEMYDCPAFNRDSTCFIAEGNATACLSWTANEVRADEYGLATCNHESVTYTATRGPVTRPTHAPPQPVATRVKPTGAGTDRRKRVRGAPAKMKPRRRPKTLS